MYYCPECGYEFESPKKVVEKHGFEEPPFEIYLVCPKCKSTSFHLKNTTHCRCCGAKLTEGKVEFCSETCKIKGMKLRKEEIRQKNLKSNGPLATYIREIEIQNNRYGTNYSYGKFVSLTRNGDEQKCSLKKRKKY